MEIVRKYYDGIYYEEASFDKEPDYMFVVNRNRRRILHKQLDNINQKYASM